MLFSLLGRTARWLASSAALAAGGGGEWDHDAEAAGAAAEGGEDGDGIEDASEHGGQGAVQRLAFSVWRSARFGLRWRSTAETPLSGWADLMLRPLPERPSIQERLARSTRKRKLRQSQGASELQQVVSHT